MKVHAIVTDLDTARLRLLGHGSLAEAPASLSSAVSPAKVVS